MRAGAEPSAHPDADADAEQFRIPDATSVGGAFRDALSDFYYNSWRLVPANLAWGALLLGVLYLSALIGVAAVLLAPVLGVPLAGVYRLAALISRGDPVSVLDAVRAWRHYLVPSLAVSAGVVLVAGAFVSNLLVAAVSSDPVALTLAIGALWALVAASAYALVFWPLLVDPRREDEPVTARARTAAAVLLASPGRVALLALPSLLVLAVGAVLFAALLTVAVAYVALVGARFVLPAADRLEGRATVPVLI